MNEVDRLLVELASHSGFSADAIRHVVNMKKRTVKDILAQLFYDMPAFEAAILTQIILKDIRPILYPLAATGVTASLLDYKSNAVRMLSIRDAMWDWAERGWLWWSYTILTNFDAVGKFAETSPVGETARPRIGTRIMVCTPFK